MLKLTAGPEGKYTAEQLATIDLEDVKKMIVLQDPKAFDKKSAAKKTAGKKAAPKKKKA
jgi:DNA topoisomerase-1